VHYVIEGSITTPESRMPTVRVVWIIDDDTPRLVSAYPLQRDWQVAITRTRCTAPRSTRARIENQRYWHDPTYLCRS
jgi:hypothetical protein